MEFRILGPVEVIHGGQTLAVGGARARGVLAMLLLNANRVVSADRLAGELWPDLDPAKAAANLQVRLTELRRALRAAGEAERLVTRPPGYVFGVAVNELDVLRFEQLAATGRAALAAGDAAAAARLLDDALALWRGPALADLGDLLFAVTERARLEDARLDAVESRVDALLACGRHQETIAELEELTAEHPLRERFWAQRLLALYRCDRQADALAAYREVRAVLVGQLGIEPGPELRQLEGRILRQDSRLEYRDSADPSRRRHRPTSDPLRRQRRHPHRLPGPRGRRARHRLRAGRDEPPRPAVGRPRDGGLLPPSLRPGAADPVRQARHRAL